MIEPEWKVFERLLVAFTTAERGQLREKKRAGAKVTAIKHLGNWLNYGMTAILVTG